MYNTILKPVLLASFFLLGNVKNGSAQLNVKVGYNLNYSENAIQNEVYQAFNATRSDLTSTFEDVTISSGLQLGLRYRSEYAGIDFTWDRFENSRLASSSQTSSYYNELTNVTNRFGLGLEAYNKGIGLGVNFYYERFQINSGVQESNLTSALINQSRYGNKIYLIFSSLGGQILSVSLQPYVAIPWSTYNYQPLINNLGLKQVFDQNRRDYHFGFTIIFYNGPQSD